MVNFLSTHLYAELPFKTSEHLSSYLFPLDLLYHYRIKWASACFSVSADVENVCLIAKVALCQQVCF